MLESSKKFEYVVSILGIHCYTMKHHNGFTNLNKNNITKTISLNTFRFEKRSE